MAILTPVPGCRHDPAIVVRFEPADLGRAERPAVDAALPPIDAAIPPAAAIARATPAGALACASEADCALVPDGCCDCANGAALKPARRRDEAKLRAAQAGACKDVMCTMMAATDRLCGKRPACVRGTCTVRPARPDELTRRLPTR